MHIVFVLLCAYFFAEACAAVESYDLVIRNGVIHDGSGKPGVEGDLAVKGDAIEVVGALPPGARGRIELDAKGLAVAPGFINMLSWATETLIHDGRSQSDIRQGVTLEIMGEGQSMGPLSPAMKRDYRKRQEDIQFEVEWTTLGEYLDWLAGRGVSCNIASFVGATTLRIHEIGYEDRKATPAELERMRALLRRGMEEGAMGVASSLIYTPAFYSDTDELVALAEIVAEHDGMYISHMRSEADEIFEALDELLEITRQAKVRSEIYHIKVAGQHNWPKIDELFRRIEAARAEGLHVTADMYTYHASGTGLSAIMPPWVQEGGHDAWIRRLKDPAIRARVAREMREASPTWSNLLNEAGGAAKILLVSFRNPKLRHLTGKSLAEVAAERRQPPEETAMDLVIEDDSRIEAVFFTMSEDNIRREIRQPWVSFCSDSGSLAPEGLFLNSNVHPRAYGSFARLLGKYVRDEQLIPLEEAIRRLTSLPAGNLKLDRRGWLKPGFYADVVVFDPATIQDHATFKEPHQYATGVQHVFVNGVQVLKDGEHTGAKPGRVVRGPGAKPGLKR